MTFYEIKGFPPQIQRADLTTAYLKLNANILGYFFHCACKQFYPFHSSEHGGGRLYTTDFQTSNLLMNVSKCWLLILLLSRSKTC